MNVEVAAAVTQARRERVRQVRQVRALRRWLRALFVLVPVALAPLLWSSTRLDADAQAVRQSQQVIDTIINARAAARQARDALHGFLLKPEPKWLEACQASAKTAWREVWRLKEMTADRPREAGGMERFEAAMGAMFQLSDELIAEKQSGRLRGIEARVEAEERINDGFRDAVGMLIDAERETLGRREEAMRRSVLVLRICTGAFALALLLVGATIWARLEALLPS